MRAGEGLALLQCTPRKTHPTIGVKGQSLLAHSVNEWYGLSCQPGGEVA
jgi:hypothetical protein